MVTEDTPAPTLYYLQVAGVSYLLDAATWREVDRWLETLDLVANAERRFARYTVDGLGGDTIAFFAGDVQTMSIETAESRRAAYQVRQDIAAERRALGFLDED